MQYFSLTIKVNLARHTVKTYAVPLDELFVMDLGSTYGTFVNKRKIDAMAYVRLRVGDVLCFGESTRLYCVLGPAEDQLDEIDTLEIQEGRAKVRWTSLKSFEVL